MSGKRERETGEGGTYLELDFTLTAAKLAGGDLRRKDLRRGRPQRLRVFDVGEAVEAVPARKIQFAFLREGKKERRDAPKNLFRLSRDALLESEESAVDSDFGIGGVLVRSSVVLLSGGSGFVCMGERIVSERKEKERKKKTNREDTTPPKVPPPAPHQTPGTAATLPSPAC